MPDVETQSALFTSELDKPCCQTLLTPEEPRDSENMLEGTLSEHGKCTGVMPSAMT